jgi:hypothetical protein
MPNGGWEGQDVREKSGYHAAVPRILRGATSGASGGDSPMSEIFPHRLTRAGGDQSVDSALNCGWGRARDIRIFGPGGGAVVAPAEMENQFGARMVVFRARSSCARRRTVGPSASRRRARRLRCHPSRAASAMGSAGDSAVGAGLLGSGVERLVRVPDDAQRADAPTCDGFCTDPSKACVFNQSGSSCVRIP